METEAYHKVKLWEEVIRSYGGSVVLATARARKQESKPVTHDFSSSTGKTLKERIEEYATACIRQNGGYASLKKIEAYVEERGIKTKKNMISWYLSTNKSKFKADRSKGWSLV